MNHIRQVLREVTKVAKPEQNQEKHVRIGKWVIQNSLLILHLVTITIAELTLTNHFATQSENHLLNIVTH